MLGLKQFFNGMPEVYMTSSGRGMFNVDFDEITLMFAEIIPEVGCAEDVGDFIEIVKPVLHDVFSKYMDSAGVKFYNQEDISYLPEHVINCINNITPPHIPYTSFYHEDKWKLRKKDDTHVIKEKKPD